MERSLLPLLLLVHLLDEDVDVVGHTLEVLSQKLVLCFQVFFLFVVLIHNENSYGYWLFKINLHQAGIQGSEGFTAS